MPSTRKKKRQSIGDRLKRLQRAFMHRNFTTGQMYNTPAQTKRSYRKITLWSLFVSDENTFLLRPHVFESTDGRTPKEWADWLANEYADILRGNILPNMSLRAAGEKQWKLYRLVGWIGESANTKAKTTKKRNRRNKTARKGK